MTRSHTELQYLIECRDCNERIVSSAIHADCAYCDSEDTKCIEQFNLPGMDELLEGKSDSFSKRNAQSEEKE